MAPGLRPLNLLGNRKQQSLEAVRAGATNLVLAGELDRLAARNRGAEGDPGRRPTA